VQALAIAALSPSFANWTDYPDTWAGWAVGQVEFAEIQALGATAVELRAALDAVLRTYPEAADIYEVLRLGIRPGR
jgi:hypothetical protein